MSKQCNILIDRLPESICVDGREYEISSDFRTGILFEMLMQDSSMSDEEKANHAMALWFPDSDPPDVEETADQIIWFYSCGRNELQGNMKPAQGQKDRGFTKRIYDFDVDAPLIYSAFLSQYGVDLQDVEDLHWWKFIAMFSGLSNDCEISKIMMYRSIDLKKIKDKKERAHYAELQAKYALPSLLSDEQKQAIAGSIFASSRR